MATPDEIATITVGSQQFRDWKTVAVSYEVGAPAAIAVFSVASPAEAGEGWAALKLKIGDACTIELAGEQVIQGNISGRQVAYDAHQHGLQITVLSDCAKLVQGTVDHKNGTFKNSTFEQIARKLMAPVGVGLTMKNKPEGADKPFPRFQVMVGETIWSAIERMGRLRNLFFWSDAQGRLVAYRKEDSEGTTALLQEGKNIRQGTAILTDEHALNKINTVSQAPGNDQNFGKKASEISYTAENPNVKKPTELTLIAEEPSDKQDLKMRAEHELATNLATQVIVNVQVQGWHAPDGKLWIFKTAENVLIKSPMMFPTPDGAMVLAIQSVSHQQADGSGTITEISLCLPGRLGGGAGRITPNANQPTDV